MMDDITKLPKKKPSSHKQFKKVPAPENYKRRNWKTWKTENNIEEVILGKSDTIQLAIITLLARGHLLIEDVQVGFPYG